MHLQRQFPAGFHALQDLVLHTGTRLDLRLLPRLGRQRHIQRQHTGGPRFEKSPLVRPGLDVPRAQALRDLHRLGRQHPFHLLAQPPAAARIYGTQHHHTTCHRTQLAHQTPSWKECPYGGKYPTGTPDQPLTIGRNTTPEGSPAGGAVQWSTGVPGAFKGLIRPCAGLVLSLCGLITALLASLEQRQRAMVACRQGIVCRRLGRQDNAGSARLGPGRLIRGQTRSRHGGKP